MARSSSVPPPPAPIDRELLAAALAALSAEQLRAQVLLQAEVIAAFQQQVVALQAQLAALEAKLDEDQQQPPRSAAPFRRPDHRRVTQPKRPGRPPGHQGRYRQAPEPDQEQVVPLVHCPECGGALAGVRGTPLVQTIDDLQVHRVSTRLTTYTCCCPHCQASVRSTHPMQVSHASGAAGCHLGRGALSLAVALNKQFGLTSHQTCRVLREWFGLPLTAGGLVHACHRLGGRLRGAYDQLLASVRQAGAVYVDETSWYVGAPKWWLHVAATPHATVYHVCDSRGAQVHRELLGERFAGVLVSDCLNIYDDSTAVQHKCHAHHGKAIREASAAHPQQGAGFLDECRQLLLASRALGDARGALTAAAFAAARRALDKRARELLAPPRREPHEERVRRRLERQRDHLFTFLDHAGVDPTNNLAERQLRPAVIARKLSCGNRTAKGAHTWQILASLAATARQRGDAFAAILAPAITPAR